MSYKFTHDFVTSNETNWKKALHHLKGLPYAKMLEVGSHEGRSAIWFLENVLTHETAEITCIDFILCENFLLNISRFGSKVRIIHDLSQVALRDKKFLEPTFDAIYIDGNHAAADVLEDAVLAINALKINGILIFDDYLWNDEYIEQQGILSDEQILRLQPKIAIDAFINIFGDDFELIHKGYQVMLRKIKNKSWQ